MSGQNKDKISIIWFRHGLRLHDNPSFHYALKNARAVYPVFIFDGEVAGTKISGYNRWKFLHENLKDLDESFKKLGTRLYCLRGNPVAVLSGLIKEWNVNRICFEQDPEPIWQERDKSVKSMCLTMNVECIESVSHTLWNPFEVIEMNGGKQPLTFQHFNDVVNMVGLPSRPLEFPEIENGVFDTAFGNNFELPSLEELGVTPEEPNQLECAEWKGGETWALELLKIRMREDESAFRSGKVLPNQEAPNLVDTSKSLSPHLRFGCLSVRKFYWLIKDTYLRVTGEEANLQSVAQLHWREYFYTMSVNNINYAQMENNEVCLQINWHDDEENLNKWTMGKTGFPWIDAIMNQMRKEGWVHHVGRHAVACFLTRGDLWINWEKGLAVFFKYLLDADWSVCAGNWLWVSSSAFENVLQCPRCFCPVRYGKAMDPTGEFVRRYVPVLKEYPLEYIFEPWKAPLEVQAEAKCVIGVDYPHPIVDHTVVAARNREYMNEIKRKTKEKNKPHCQPSDSKETEEFSWLHSLDICESELHSVQ